MLTVGVDSAKATLEATAWQQGRAVRLGTFAQTADGWAALRDAVVRLQRPPTGCAGRGAADTDQEPVALVLEPTGGYELAFALWARRQPGWQVHRPNPARVRAWAHSQGLRAKTDRQDAALLARFGASAQPALAVWQPLASEVSELDQVLRRRDDVADALRRERQRHEQRERAARCLADGSGQRGAAAQDPGGRGGRSGAGDCRAGAASRHVTGS